MEISIFHISCYRCYVMIWRASIWCLEWIWVESLITLVQVSRFSISSGKFDFHEIWELDFELWCFLAYDDDSNSFSTSFGNDLSTYLVHLVKVSWKCLFCSFCIKWPNSSLWFCFVLVIWGLWLFEHLQKNIQDVFEGWWEFGESWFREWVGRSLVLWTF